MSNDKMREALEFYSDPTNWISGDVPGHVYAIEDAGRFAREALKAQPKFEGYCLDLSQQPGSEPVGWMVETNIGPMSLVTKQTLDEFLAEAKDKTLKAVPLYAHPQPSAQVPGRMTTRKANELKCVEFANQREVDLFITGWNMCRREILAAPSVAEKRKWIICEERLPTQEDADDCNAIWAFGAPTANPVRITAWNNLHNLDTHWMPTGLQRPAAPSIAVKPSKMPEWVLDFVRKVERLANEVKNAPKEIPQILSLCLDARSILADPRVTTEQLSPSIAEKDHG